METKKWIVGVALVLSGFSVLAAVLAHLALLDVRHGESDLALEWTVLRMVPGVIVAAQGWVITTLLRVLRNQALDRAS